MIGQRVRRLEDRRFLTGAARFVADVRRAGMVHAAILRSPYAHARIEHVNAARALARPGVTAVLTAADLQGGVPRIPIRLWPLDGLQRALQPVLATDRVRYSGEPVAVVVAASRYAAEDALEDVEVEYAPLPAIAEMAVAVSADAPVLHDDVPNNVGGQLRVDVGDVDSAFSDADIVVSETFRVQRHSGVPLETRGLVAEYDAGRGILQVWGPTKVSHFNRMVLARLLDLPERNVHFIETDVGGGFGVRGEFYPEDFLVPYLARRLGVPVAWIEDRAENLKACNHSREQEHEVELGLTSEGRILGLRGHVRNCMGAYVRTHGATVPTMMVSLLLGPYEVPNYRYEVDCVLTNRTPTGTYRGPGRFEGTFVRERLLDEAARRLGIDATEIRRRNFIKPETMPRDLGINAMGLHVRYDSGDYGGQFEETLAAVGYEEMREFQNAAQALGRTVGIGLGCFVEKSGLGQWEYARVELGNRGDVTVYTGVESLGQGVETALAQVCAETLGLLAESVTVVHGDTQLVPYGVGAFASRGAVLGGSAVHLAAAKVRDRVLGIAAELLEAAPGDLRLRDGRVDVEGQPGRSLPLTAVAEASQPSIALRRGDAPGISEVAFFTTDELAYPYGIHIAMVELDTETGDLRILRYVIAYDVGRAINPMLVEGQLLGGLAQGIGGSLLEEFVYDEGGQLLSGSFMDYLLPTALDVPRTEILLTEDHPSPFNPLGVKGAGEGGTVGAPAALANAVADALGVPVRELPLTPTRILALVHTADPVRTMATQNPSVAAE